MAKLRMVGRGHVAHERPNGICGWLKGKPLLGRDLLLNRLEVELHARGNYEGGLQRVREDGLRSLEDPDADSADADRNQSSAETESGILVRQSKLFLSHHGLFSSESRP